MKSQKITKKEICQIISINTQINQKTINIIFDEIFKVIKSELKDEKSLTITNFGRLKMYRNFNLNNKKCYSIKIKKSKKGWKNEEKTKTNSN